MKKQDINIVIDEVTHHEKYLHIEYTMNGGDKGWLINKADFEFWAQINDKFDRVDVDGTVYGIMPLEEFYGSHNLGFKDTIIEYLKEKEIKGYCETKEFLASVMPKSMFETLGDILKPIKFAS